MAIDCPYQYYEGNASWIIQQETLRRVNAKSWTFVKKRCGDTYVPGDIGWRSKWGIRPAKYLMYISMKVCA
jgi:hypothetical protein